MISPEASDFAWIFVVKPPRERPSACPSCPLCSGRRHMRAHDRRVEHLDQVRGRTHRGKRVKEGFEDASLAQSVEAFPHAIPGTKAPGKARHRTFSRVKKSSASRKRRSSLAFRPRRGRQARNTASVCAQSFSSIFVDIDPGPRFGRSPMNHVRFTSGIPKMPSLQNSSTRPSYWKWKHLNPSMMSKLSQSLICVSVQGMASGINRSLLDLANPVSAKAISHDW